MGQGPTQKMYAVIGDGRWAQHLKTYLKITHSQFTCWSRKNQADFELTNILHQKPVVLLAISDGAIDEFVKKIFREISFPIEVIHFSAATEVENAKCLHPLFSFTKRTLDLESYKRIPFCEPDQYPGLFQSVFPQWKNPTFQLSLEQRRLYHALLVASGNFTSLLWKTVEEQFKRDLNLDPALLEPYKRTIFQNLLTHPSSAVTGPFVREDFQTIQQNLLALENNSLQEIYKSFVQQYMATEKTQ